MQVNRVGLETPLHNSITINMNVGENKSYCSIMATPDPRQVALVLAVLHQELFPCLRDKENSVHADDLAIVKGYCTCGRFSPHQGLSIG